MEFKAINWQCKRGHGQRGVSSQKCKFHLSVMSRLAPLQERGAKKRRQKVGELGGCVKVIVTFF